MGAGRTELAHAICGFTRRDSGEVIIEGQKVQIEDYRSAMDNGCLLYTSRDGRGWRNAGYAV